MTILPNGNIGIYYNDPKNLLSIKRPFGMDFYNRSESYQDIRFNCYQNNEYLDKKEEIDSSSKNIIQYGYLNVLPGYSAIIQGRNTEGYGSMLLAVSKSNDSSSMATDFFEYFAYTADQPMGIMLLNFTKDSMNYTNTGIGSFPDSVSRLKIQVRTNDTSMNALKIVDSHGSPIFTIRNDGFVCTKEVMIQLDGQPCWGDYVFHDDYKLLPLDELEKKIKKDKRLPEMPTANEVEKNGINLGEMQAILVKKIEELTLYVIELKKENIELRKLFNK